jgi:predicted phage tail protein
MPGIKRHSQAYREAVERLNKLTLSDLAISFETFSEGLEVMFGDIITVTTVLGLTNKEFRVIAVPEMVANGRWLIKAEEYDAAAYSDQIITKASTPDTTIPVNAPPLPVTNIQANEVTYQLQNGKYASRIVLSWDASPSLFVLGYTVKVYEGMDIVWSTTVDSLAVSTSPLKELVNYNIEIRPYTSLFVGTAANTNYSIIGKTAIPDAPASLSGFEAGGEVRLNWPASTDIDAERYEVRYGDTAGSWETATVIDIVDGLRLVTKDVPPSRS